MLYHAIMYYINMHTHMNVYAYTYVRIHVWDSSSPSLYTHTIHILTHILTHIPTHIHIHVIYTGETVAARLIQKAGSLTNLAKCPASTVQILGT